MPAGVEEGILRGMYCLGRKDKAQARLLASGPILKEAVAAANLLQQHWQIDAEVWSVTSFTELARDGVAAQRERRLSGGDAQPYVTQQLQGGDTPVIAVSDYIRTLPESIRAFVPATYVTLGTDGFGRSDTRVNLRDFFEIDARWIAYTALTEIFAGDRARLEAAAKTLGIDTGKPLSSTV